MFTRSSQETGLQTELTKTTASIPYLKKRLSEVWINLNGESKMRTLNEVSATDEMSQDAFVVSHLNEGGFSAELGTEFPDSLDNVALMSDFNQGSESGEVYEAVVPGSSVFVAEDFDDTFSEPDDLMVNNNAMDESYFTSSLKVTVLCEDDAEDEDTQDDSEDATGDVEPDEFVMTSGVEEEADRPSSVKSDARNTDEKNCTKRTHHCNVCDKSFCSNFALTTHQRVHSGDRPFRCDECGKTFTQRAHLCVHARIHTEQKPYSCDECGSLFTARSSLTKHLRIHSGERPYACTHCGRRFSRTGHLHRHLTVHAEIPGFRCSICRKSFRNVDQLTEHSKTQCRQNLHACDECGKNFAQKNQLLRHMKGHQGVRTCECETCGKSFFQLADLKMHVRVHTGEKPFTCQICGKSYVQNGSLKVHMSKHSNFHTD